MPEAAADTAKPNGAAPPATTPAESGAGAAPAAVEAGTKVASSPDAAQAAETRPPSLIGAADAGNREGKESPPGEAKAKAGAEGKDPPPKAPAAAEAQKSPQSPDTGEAKPPEKTEAKDAKDTEGGKEAKPPEGGEKTAEDGKAEAGKAETLAETPPVPPTYSALKLPDGVAIDQARLAEADKLFGEIETATKADHAAVEAMRQKFGDFHITELQRAVAEMRKHQIDTWNRTNEQWINRVKEDPEIGGNRVETSLGNAKFAVLEMMGMKPAEAAAFITALDVTGGGNHPDIVRGLHRLYEKYREPSPVIANPPMPPKEAGSRGWYDRVDGASAIPAA